jgi:hypothetical protein
MKKLIATSLLITALAFVPRAYAETVECSTSSQYGGESVCGTSTSSETVVTHETVNAGIADWSFYEIIAFAGITAVAATGLYKLSYKWYLLG